jgi:hypothetical protein
VGNAALETQMAGASEEPSRRQRLGRWLARAARPPWKVWREVRTAYFREWEVNRSLADLPESTAPSLKRHATALAPTALPIRLLDEYVVSWIVLAALAGVAVGLIAPQAWLDRPSGGSEWVQTLAVWLPLATLAGAITLAPLTAWAHRILGQRGKFLFAVGTGCIWLTVLISLDRWGAPFGLGGVTTYAASAAALAAATITAGFLALIVVYVALVYSLRRVAIARYADSVLAQSLLEAMTNLFFLDGREHEGIAFDPRREAVHGLETAAVTAERYLPRLLNPRDEATATWLRERTAEWASALRAHKRWILTERARDEKAVERLRETLRAVADGDWNQVERRPAYQASRGSRARVLVATGLRGAAPLVAAVLLRVFGVPGFDGQIGDYVLVASGAWLALSFLAQYDPLFSAKIGAAADISKTLRG